MVEPIRVTPEYAKKQVAAGKAMLVCAYDDEQKFRNLHLEGALSLQEFTAMVERLPKEQEIIFYCA